MHGHGPALRFPPAIAIPIPARDRAAMIAVILAGSRPGTDPLLAGTDYPSKALYPVAGQPMLAHVLRAVSDSDHFERVIVAAQQPDLLRDDPAIAAAEPDAEWRTSGATIAATMRDLLGALEGPLFVTTADNVLLSPAIIGEFLTASAGADIAVGMVEQRTYRAAGIDAPRTWLPFRGGKWSGANLFRLSGAQVEPVLARWAEVEQARKKGRKVIGAFGLVPLLGAALRLSTIQSFAAGIGRRYGLDARAIALSAAEACVDADKPADIPVIERLLAARSA